MILRLRYQHRALPHQAHLAAPIVWPTALCARAIVSRRLATGNSLWFSASAAFAYRAILIA